MSIRKRLMFSLDVLVKEKEHEWEWENRCFRCFDDIKVGRYEFKGNWGFNYCFNCMKEIESQIPKKLLKNGQFVLTI